MNNIVLIGMPSVGKSTLGVILAKLLGYGFVDTDLIIQEKTGKLLGEIIAKEGVDAFIAIEEKIISELCVQKSVISTGGSVIYGEKAMRHLADIGEILYLKQDLQTIKRRITDIHGRGVVLKDGQDFEAMFYERAALYEKYAMKTVEFTSGTIEENLQLIVDAINERKEKC